jgi:hypothetical protein
MLSLDWWRVLGCSVRVGAQGLLRWKNAVISGRRQPASRGLLLRLSNAVEPAPFVKMAGHGGAC